MMPRPLASEPIRTIESPYLNSKQAAHYLGYASADSLRHALADGVDIPVLRRGRTLLFHREQLDRWLAGESRLRLMSEARR